MFMSRWKVPTGPFQYYPLIKLLQIQIKISLSFVHKNDSHSLMYFNDWLVDVNETVHRLNPTLLGG
jgi:hypothetical protein